MNTYPLDGGPGLWLLFAFIPAFALLIIPWVFFLLNLRGLLWRVNPVNRSMAPDHVWLNFIPLFGLGWFVYTVVKVHESVKAEYRGRGWHPDGDFGFGAGLAAAILWIVVAFFWWLPVIGWVIDVAWLICWIVYWLKTDDLKRRLAAGAAPGPGWQQTGVWRGPTQWQGQSQWQGPTPGWQPPQQPPVQQPSAASPSPQGQPSAGSTPPPTPSRQCAVCGTTFTSDDRFCRGCGLPLP